MLLELVQNLIPQRLKNYLKTYFRLIFPNKLMSVLWITFRCTYKCSYCPYCGPRSNYPQQFPISCEKSGKEWISTLEKMPPTSFYISGGEPFLYKDLPYIINNLPKKHSIIGIVTNVSLPLDVYKKVKKRIHLNVSFHREFTSEDEFIEKVQALKDYFHITVNIVATEENMDFIKNKLEIFKKNKIAYHVDPLVNSSNKPHEYTQEYKQIIDKYLEKSRSLEKENLLAKSTTKKCSAGRNYYNLLPNGDALLCSRAMEYKHSPFIENIYNPKNYLGNIFDETFKLIKNNTI
jgi:MoaA/NifB/PqqE/SkfB family radical SAM enzyme